MYRKILIATDGSEIAGKALTHGLALAKAVGASMVTVVTVTEIWSARVVIEAEEGKTGQVIEQYEMNAAEHAARFLAAAHMAATNVCVACKTHHVKDNHPSDGILSAAKGAGCDLIVVSTHGRRGLNRVLLGSVATEVITYAKIPVLVVR